MKTLLVMCIVLTSTSPSCTPLLRTAASTSGVTFLKAILEGMLKVRYSVWDFMALPLMFSGHDVCYFEPGSAFSPPPGAAMKITVLVHQEKDGSHDVVADQVASALRK